MKKIYSPISAWHHWSPQIFDLTVIEGKKEVSYKIPDEMDSALSLATGFQCLFQTLQVFEEYFKYGFSKELEIINNDYLTAVGVNKSINS